MFIDFKERKWRGREEKKTSIWERNVDQLPPVHAPTGDGTHSPGMCSDQQLNPQPSVYQTMLQPIKPSGQGSLVQILANMVTVYNLRNIHILLLAL